MHRPISILAFIAMALLTGCGNVGSNEQSTDSNLVWVPFPIGSIDFDAYCKRMHGAAAHASADSATDPYSWKCRVGSQVYDIAWNDTCLQQYGAPSAAMVSDAGNANSWTCWGKPPFIDHCRDPDGSEFMDVASIDPTGVNGVAGYEVFGEPSTWDIRISANAFSYSDNPILYVPGTFDGNAFTVLLNQGRQPRIHVHAASTPPITSSSPLQHTLVLDLPCGTRTWLTRPLTRIYPTKAATPTVNVSATYVNSGTPVTLSVGTQLPLQAGTCGSDSLLRIVGTQPYDGKVVLDMTFNGDKFISGTYTVKPQITTEYSATYYCIVNPSIRNSAKATVQVYGGSLNLCPGNTPPPTFWFCRDCPYNTPPLTNTIVQTACTYDEAQQLAEQTTFGGTCTLADGKCPSCPNPASCPPP